MLKRDINLANIYSSILINCSIVNCRLTECSYYVLEKSLIPFNANDCAFVVVINGRDDDCYEMLLTGIA